MVKKKPVLEKRNFKVAIVEISIMPQEKKEESQIDEQTATNLATYAFLVNHPEENFA